MTYRIIKHKNGLFTVQKYRYASELYSDIFTYENLGDCLKYLSGVIGKKGEAFDEISNRIDIESDLDNLIWKKAED